MKSNDIEKGDHRSTCEGVLARLITEVDRYQLGKTKIFFRAGQVCHYCFTSDIVPSEEDSRNVSNEP